jgi:hypothetical protein
MASKAGSNNAYGQFWVGQGDDKRRMYAHRVAWELTYGKFPDEVLVCHNCPNGDNPGCCNPKHLFLGTNKDNSQDMVKKGKSTKGSRNPTAKLNEEQVAFILKRVADGERQCDLADEYQVSRATICNIVKGKVWK